MNNSVKKGGKPLLTLSPKQAFLNEKVSTSELISDTEKDLTHFFIRMWMDFHKFETATFGDFLNHISNNKIEDRLKKIPLFIQVMEIMKKTFEKQGLPEEAKKFQIPIKS